MLKYKLLLYICIGLNISVMAQQTSENIKSVNSLEDKVYGLSLLWSEVKYNFVNIDRLDFDVDSLYRETMKKVLVTTNDVDYYKELSNFLRSFKDAHTELLDMPDSGMEDIDYPKYSTKRFGDKFYFVNYRLNCSDVDPRLLGAEIIEIEDMPTLEYVEKYVIPERTGSTLNYILNSAGTFLLNGIAGTYIKAKALCSDGKVIDFNIIRDGEATRTDQDKYFPEIKQRSRKTVTYDWKDKIAVLKISRFIPESISDEIDNAMSEIKSKNPTGLIIDLRGNGGGETDVALRLQMHLTKADSIKSFGTQSRTNLGYGRAQGNYDNNYKDYFEYKAYQTFPAEVIERDKSIVPIQCPVAILIDTYSFSACEDFLINIYEMPGRPVLIGEETAGSTGAPLVIELPHEACARLCTLRALYPYSMKPFVNQGILPDIEAKPTVDEYIKGIDVAMLKAIDILNKY